MKPIFIIIDKQDNIKSILGLVPKSAEIIEPFFESADELIALLLNVITIYDEGVILFPWLFLSKEKYESFESICKLIERSDINHIIVSPNLINDSSVCRFPNISTLIDELRKNGINVIPFPEKNLTCKTISECILRIALLFN